jgi:hypothetical protein
MAGLSENLAHKSKIADKPEGFDGLADLLSD